MKSEREIEDRLDGCVVELDGHLHPQGGINEYDAAVVQGWIHALSWVIDRETPYDRSDEITEVMDDA